MPGVLQTDPPNDLSQGEATMFNGTGSQTDTNGRWGDYSMTTVDPSDGMTFWHVNEYYAKQPVQLAHAHRQVQFPRWRPKPDPNTDGHTAAPLPAAGQPDRTCQVSEPAWLVSFSRPMGSFTLWADVAADSVGSEFTHPFEYDPVTNTWTTKSATYPDTHVNNMACGVLNDSGTPYIYCVGGSQVTLPDIFDRVFRYDPVTDVISPVAAPWPGAQGTILPGGFTVFNNKLYILGGFDTITNGGKGPTRSGSLLPPAVWVQKNAVLPVPLGYIPTTTIGSLIYTGGGSDITGGAITDTTNSFVYNPVADTIGTIASIPRATGETRALNFEPDVCDGWRQNRAEPIE